MHQQATHFKCDVCAMVAVSMKHLKLHKKNTHIEKICEPCGLKFSDERRQEVHILKEHPFKCQECGDKYTRKATLDIHITTKHPKQMKCIVCEYKALNETEITKHYEEVHLSSIQSTAESSDAQVDICRNGLTCHYLKQNRCNFRHVERTEQPWERVQPRRWRQTREQSQGRPAQLRQVPRPEARQEDRQQQPRRQERRQDQLSQGSRRLDKRQVPTTMCRNGKSCIYHKYNKCNFIHENLRQGRQEGHCERQRGNVDQLRPCKFGPKCDKGVRCGFLHLPSDFLSLQGGMRN